MIEITLLLASIILASLSIWHACKKRNRTDPNPLYHDEFQGDKFKNLAYIGGASTLATILLHTQSHPNGTLTASLSLFALSIVLIQITRPKIKKQIKEALEVGKVATIITTHPSGISVGLWIKQNSQEWPPVLLEVSISEYNVPAIDAPKELLRLVESSLTQIQPAQLHELKAHLKTLGITHPLDVEGANSSPPILNFFENLLLT